MIYIILLIFLVGIYLIYENKVFKVNKVILKNQKISCKIKIVQISDYHLNPLINIDKLKRVIKKFSPDLVFFTGDLINRNSSEKDIYKLEKLVKIFETTTFFVSGNHEFENNNKKVLYDILNKYEIKSLDNKNIVFKDINICGKFYKGKSSNLVYLDNMYNILLIHDPLDFIYNESKNFDLVLSGHIHGGQVRLPLVGALIDPYYNIFPKYSKGFYKIRNSLLFISSGLGSKFFLRTFNRVELNLFELNN